MCHALLADIKYFKVLLLIDQELAEQTRALGCPCGGPLHQAHFPRKPRSCPSEVRNDFARRYSFCCGQCRRRITSASVRFLGRRVHLALAVVLVSARGPTPAAARQLARQLLVAPRTVLRWRRWWRDQFPQTGFWQAACARFMPSVEMSLLPASLLERFSGAGNEPLLRLLVFLSPITVGQPVTVREGC